MNTLFYRLRSMLLGWGFVGLVYTSSHHLQGEGRVIAPSAIELWIPFSPEGVWLYLSFFILVPFGYLRCPLQQVKWLSTSMQLSAVAAGAVYLLWPTTMHYPVDQGASLSSSLLAALIAVDSAQNCLPSLHMTLTILAVWACCEAKQILRTVILIIWGLAIAFSILQLRRHLLIDLLSGALLAWVAGCLARRVKGSRRTNDKGRKS
ncbi:MAG: phosphatase PAP2 family protein [Azoarcus sp.]|jgi:membrane-associated phospholipid phosphatase|nr:phosphatase PAP2 family protein [Azoarcus sp.]